MFYIKTEHGGKQIKVEIFGDEIYTICFNCGKEIQVDDETLREVMKDGDLSSTSLSCCSNKKPELTVIK
ncbi:hypothetical protein L1N85_10910 [Paenibacillus alkaliterrae]|uniref:hypothetical protein n=1 Tax=Paenibacillus alkaliterrae TaxID=320909 RepID=UPI001F31858C|nr:hypothetical protein [Paenibacillus alkaliterrae]MCF2938946.1 hypothetical protein [Paenibacillus alkaliterrae]